MERRRLPRPKKTLGTFSSPWVLSLMRLMETQSKETLVRWATACAEAQLLPVYERARPGDPRPREALSNAVGWLEGRVRFADARETNQGAHDAATEAAADPAAQAAARACAHAALTIHVPAHALGLAFYGTAALGYAEAGPDAPPDVLERSAATACARMEAALRAASVPDELHPAKLGWKLWRFLIAP